MHIKPATGCALLRETAYLKKVYKYGGTSVDDPVKLVKNLRTAFEDPNAVSIVLSAPAGVTDLAYALADPDKREESMREIERIYNSILDGLSLPSYSRLEVLEGLCEMRRLALELELGDSMDYLVTRGESLITIIVEGLGGGEWRRAKAEKFIRLTKNRTIDLRATQQAYARYDDFPERSIVNGFTGLDRDGNVRALDRNGTDSTAMVTALLRDVKLVRKGTDQAGILATDPQFVSNADTISLLGHAQLISMSERGRAFLQTSAMMYARKGGITLEVFSSANPGGPITRIYPDGCRGLSAMHDVVSVVGKPGFLMFSIDKIGMDNMFGFTERVLKLLRREFQTRYIYSTTGEENVDFVVPALEIAGREDEVVSRIRSTFRVDSITVQRLAVISVIGKDFGRNPRMVARVYDSLDTTRWGKTQMLFHEQSFKGASIVIGVEESRLKPTIQSIYDMVVKIRR